MQGKIFDGNLDPKEFYIEHCNTKIPAEATYCPVCGSKVLDVRKKEVVHKELAKKAIPTYEKEVVDQNEGLFSNTGNRIKGFAKLFLFLNFIISIGIAYLVYAFLDGISREDISILPVLLTSVVTFIIGWLFSLPIYGFGQMMIWSDD